MQPYEPPADHDRELGSRISVTLTKLWLRMTSALELLVSTTPFAVLGTKGQWPASVREQPLYWLLFGLLAGGGVLGLWAAARLASSAKARRLSIGLLAVEGVALLIGFVFGDANAVALGAGLISLGLASGLLRTHRRGETLAA